MEEIQQIKTSIIIPAYNEEESIEKVLSGLWEYLNRGCEIIVVNDGSTDNTREILKKMPNIRVVHHAQNLGYGAAIKSGIREARGEYILIIDADGTYPTERISDLLSQKENYDMVVGARINPQRQIPALRRPPKWILNKLANYLTKTKIPDLNSGLRIIKKEAVEKFFDLLPDGFSFTTTITLALLTNHHLVKYLPIDYYKRKGKSKIKPIGDTLNFIQLILRTVLYFNPLKVFVVFSLIIFAIALIVGVVSILFTPRFMDTTFVILCTTALQTFFLGLIAELITKKK